MMLWTIFAGIALVLSITLSILVSHYVYKSGLKMGFRLCEALYKGTTESLADVRPERYEEPAEFGLLDRTEEEKDGQKEAV